MKIRLSKLIVLSLTILTMAACDNDIDINAPFKDITVVYSLLDGTKDTNWVRVHRAYLGKEGMDGGNQVPDSIYYKNLQVKIEEVSANGTVLNSWLLQRDDNSRQMEEGYFTTSGYHLYRFDQNINPNNSYRLTIEKPDGEGDPVTGITPIVGGFNVTEPRGVQKVTFGRSGQNFSWEQPKNGRIHQAMIRFYYVEINRNNKSDSVRKYVDYQLPTKLGTTLNGSTTTQIVNNVPYSTYYRYLSNTIPFNENVNRFFRKMDVYVVCGADDFATYISVSQPAEGIVQDKPFYTNVTNGAGLFSSRGFTDKTNMELSSISLDSLFNGVFTCGLRFGKQIGLDTCYCFEPGAGGWICE
jgi:hypothetical protein